MTPCTLRAHAFVAGTKPALFSNRMRWPACTVWTLSLGALAVAVAAIADAPTTTYRWVDPQGVVHYSDTPQPGSQQVQIPPVQTYRATPAAPTPPAGQSSDTVPDAYRACAVAQPEAEQSFYAPDTVSVALNLDPPLRSGDQVSVSFDGHALDPQDQSGLHYRIEAPERGEHTLAVSVRNAAGSIVCSSSAMTFYVQRPSVLSPQSPQSSTRPR